MTKTYQGINFFEVIDLLKSVCKANEAETPRQYFTEISVKPNFTDRGLEKGEQFGFTVLITSETDK